LEGVEEPELMQSLWESPWPPQGAVQKFSELECLTMSWENGLAYSLSQTLSFHLPFNGTLDLVPISATEFIPCRSEK
jgi:hypothetical protein